MSSSPDGAGVAAYVCRSLEVLRRECPAAYLSVCRRLAPRTVAVEVDGEPVLLAFRPLAVDVVAALERPDVRVSTTWETVLAVLNAESTLAEAAWTDAIALQGSTDDLARFHDALLDYVLGAVRCPSFPALPRPRPAAGRSGSAGQPRLPRRRAVSVPAATANRTRTAPAARTSANDAAYLYAESPTAPMNAGGVTVLDPSPRPGGRLTAAEVIERLATRLPRLPRLRQRLAFVPFEAGRPVWVDDADFDLRYHVRPAVLPAPGGRQDLARLVEQVHAAPLERSRPLWELYVVEGLAGGRVALLMKWHHAMADGMSGVAMLRALSDGGAEEPAGMVPWQPAAAPSPLDLLGDALGEQLRDGRRAAAALGSFLSHPARALERSSTALRGLFALGARPPLQRGPLNTPVSPYRRFAMAELAVPTARSLASAAECSVNDVLLTSLAAALGKLFERRGLDRRGRVQRALVPVSVRGRGDRASFGNRAGYFLVDLPIGPMDEVDRLRRVAARTAAARASGQHAAVATLHRAGDWIPPPWHAFPPDLRRGPDLISLVVSYVRGPQRALSFLGARNLVSYPIPPIGERLALTVAFASLGGTIGVGLMADWVAMPDADQAADDLSAAFAVLERRMLPAVG